MKPTALSLAPAGLLACLLAVPAQACALKAEDGRAVVGDGVQLAWQVVDASGADQSMLPSRHFSLLMRICPANAELQAVDASMPAHRHGMNYQPTLQRLGDGQWRADGLLFHMRGRWELRWDVRADGRSQSLRQAVELP